VKKALDYGSLWGNHRFINEVRKVIPMEDINEPGRRPREAKENVKEDIAEVRQLLKKIAKEASEGVKGDIAEARETLRNIAEEAREGGIKETTQRVGRKLEKAMAIMTESAIDTGSVVTREMDFSDFANVEVDCAFRVEITHSDSYRVTVTANKKLFDHIDVTKSGNTLRVSLKLFHLRFYMRPILEVRIAMPILNRLRLAGATRSMVRGFSSQEGLDLNLSGASRLDVDMEAGEAKCEVSGASRVSGSMKVGDAEFTLSGASRAELSGSANNVILSAWGASKLDLADFTLNDASVHLKGASRAMINVNGKLDLDMSGASRLNYIGDPTLRDVSVSGASRLRHR